MVQGNNKIKVKHTKINNYEGLNDSEIESAL